MSQETNQLGNRKEHNFETFVNSRPRKVLGPEISFVEVLTLAGVDVTGQDLGLYDVELVHGNKAGTLCLRAAAGKGVIQGQAEPIRAISRRGFRLTASPLVRVLHVMDQITYIPFVFPAQ